MKKTLAFISSLFTICNLAFINTPVFAEEPSITVATASNVQFAMNELKKEFKKESGIEVKHIISSSGKLTAQIKSGAPFDVFMSADIEFPEKLYQEGFTSEKPVIYAYGTLVLWTMKELDLSNGIEILKRAKIEKIALANPKNAPYGEEAINTLNYYKLFDKVKDKFIFAESISQVNNYITIKGADIGFTAKSVVLAPEMKNKGKWIEIDKKSYKPIAQGVTILKYGEKNNLTASKKFYNFLFSKKAKQIFDKYGYIVKK